MGVRICTTNSSFALKEGCSIADILKSIEENAELSYPEQDTVADLKKEIDHYQYLPPIIQLCEIVKRGWGFAIDLGHNKVDYVWEKMTGAEMNWMKEIAVYVQTDSFVEMNDDFGNCWRYVFDGETVKEVWS